MKIKQILIAIIAILGLGGGGAYLNNQLSGVDNAYLTSNTIQATTSVSNCQRSSHLAEPTSTDPSVTISGTHMPWVCATSSNSGYPEYIPSYTDNQGIELCIDEDNTGQAIRFWLKNITNASNSDMTVGKDSTGILLKAGNCWDSRELGIIWPGRIYTLASSTTSTVQYKIFR